jgi:hypothetical protein
LSVEWSNTIDIVSIDPKGQVVLTISDHLDWTDSIKHQRTLQNKLNAYVAFVESGEILEQYPEAKDRPLIFKIVFKFRPDGGGQDFLAKAQNVVKSAGFSLQHEVFAESYDN